MSAKITLHLTYPAFSWYTCSVIQSCIDSFDLLLNYAVGIKWEGMTFQPCWTLCWRRQNSRLCIMPDTPRAHSWLLRNCQEIRSWAKKWRHFLLLDQWRQLVTWRVHWSIWQILFQNYRYELYWVKVTVTVFMNVYQNYKNNTYYTYTIYIYICIGSQVKLWKSVNISHVSPVWSVCLKENPHSISNGSGCTHAAHMLSYVLTVKGSAWTSVFYPVILPWHPGIFLRIFCYKCMPFFAHYFANFCSCIFFISAIFILISNLWFQKWKHWSWLLVLLVL